MIIKLKRLSAEVFDRVADETRLGVRARSMARAVLVDGRLQAEVAAEHGVTYQRVSLAVGSIERAYRQMEASMTGMIQVVLDMPEVMAVEVASLAQALQQCEDTALAHEVLQRVLVSARRGRRRLDMHPARKKEESAPVPEEVSHAKVATGT